MQDFERLAVWAKSHDLTLGVYRATGRRVRPGMGSLVSQLRRAAASIPANIAEGCGHETARELARYLQLSMASASELQYHLRLAHDLHVLTETEYRALASQLQEVKRMLTGLLRSVRLRAQGVQPKPRLDGRQPSVDDPLSADG